MVTRFWSSNDFDSVLYSPNQRNISTLTLLVRVHLNPFNPGTPGKNEENFFHRDLGGGPGGTNYVFQRWGAAEFATYQAAYKREVEYFLNWPLMGLWLLPASLGDAAGDTELREFMHAQPISQRFGAVVRCALSCTIVNSAAQSHVSYDVLRLKDGQPAFRAYNMTRFNRRDGGMITNKSIQAWPPPRDPKHSTVAHELGHSLGLKHINRNDPRCVNGNERICYGRPGTAQRRNLMGGGNDITSANAGPWARAIYQHTSRLVWEATDQMPKEMHFLR